MLSSFSAMENNVVKVGARTSTREDDTEDDFGGMSWHVLVFRGVDFGGGHRYDRRWPPCANLSFSLCHSLS